MTNSTRIIYLRDISYRPVGTLVVSVNRQKNTAEYQLSTLNPADRFDRKEGQLIALRNLVERPITVLLPVCPTMHDVSRAVMTSLSQSDFAPSRAVKAAKLWLRYRSE